MPDEKIPAVNPNVENDVDDPATAKVKIAPPADGSVDLTRDLNDALQGVELSEGVDPQVAAALQKLREGTQEGLSSTDHYDLGVAYMGMGLVDDAVREFNAAKKGEKKAAKRPLRKPVKKAAKKAAKAARRTVKKVQKPVKKALKKVQKPVKKALKKAIKAVKKSVKKPAKKTAKKVSKRPAKKARR